MYIRFTNNVNIEELRFMAKSIEQLAINHRVNGLIEAAEKAEKVMLEFLDSYEKLKSSLESLKPDYEQFKNSGCDHYWIGFPYFCPL